MEKKRPQAKQGGSGLAGPAPENVMLSHLSGIELLQQGKLPADINETGEIYDLSILPQFTLCACYLGYVNYKIQGRETAEIPVGLIWDLFNSTSALTTGRHIVDQHMMILEKAFELLGFRADISVKENNIVVIDGISKTMARKADETKRIGFSAKGIHPDLFSQMLMRNLLRSF
jgi:hypothetical protein